MSGIDHEFLMNKLGLPYPNGTLLGDLQHISAVFRDYEEDHVLLVGSYNVVGPDVSVGLTVGDIRKLTSLLESLHAVVEE